jgi:hypothetical protein
MSSNEVRYRLHSCYPVHCFNILCQHTVLLASVLPVVFMRELYVVSRVALHCQQLSRQCAGVHRARMINSLHHAGVSHAQAHARSHRGIYEQTR